MDMVCFHKYIFLMFPPINDGCVMVNAGTYTIPGSCGYAAHVCCCLAIGLVMSDASGWGGRAMMANFVWNAMNSSSGEISSLLGAFSKQTFVAFSPQDTWRFEDKPHFDDIYNMFQVRGRSTTPVNTSLKLVDAGRLFVCYPGFKIADLEGQQNRDDQGKPARLISARFHPCIYWQFLISQLSKL